MGTYVIGRKDLPKAANMVGFQMGRIIGMLQGARAKADRFAMNNEMKVLQNELRSGLRELDAVKGEMALAASSQGLVGKGFRSALSGTSNSNLAAKNNLQASNTSATTGTNNLPSTSKPLPNNSINYLAASSAASQSGIQPPSSPLTLAPRDHAVAAVAEEEWKKQGIGFVSRAEMGTHMQRSNPIDTQQSNSASAEALGGSFLLADIMQQSLIHDQYDRTVQEQDELLRSKVDSKLEEKQNARLKKEL